MTTPSPWVVLVVTLAAAGARGQGLPAADIEQQWVDPAGRGSLLVGNGLTLKALEFRMGVAGMYTRANLRAGSRILLEDRVGAQVFGALGLWNWLEVGAVIPVIIAQTTSASGGVASGGLANPWLHAKVTVLDELAPVTFAIGLGLGLPLGTDVALGNGGLGFAPRVQLGKVYDVWHWGVELGFLYRPEVDYSGVSGRPLDTVGSQVFLAAMAATTSQSGPRGELSIRVHAPLTGSNVGAELQVGARWPAGPVELFASAGPGFFGEPATPSLRVVVGAAVANTVLTQPTCVEGKRYPLWECPQLDRDGDGVLNGVDRAPEEPEDLDGFEDADGRPDLDNDADAVPDKEDGCPDVPGAKANRGCPDVDQDRDGVVDRLDGCPAEAEDGDGVDDGDGCPEP